MVEEEVKRKAEQMHLDRYVKNVLYGSDDTFARARRRRSQNRSSSRRRRRSTSGRRRRSNSPARQRSGNEHGLRRTLRSAAPSAVRGEELTSRAMRRRDERTSARHHSDEVNREAAGRMYEEIVRAVRRRR